MHARVVVRLVQLRLFHDRLDVAGGHERAARRWCYMSRSTICLLIGIVAATGCNRVAPHAAKAAKGVHPAERVIVQTERPAAQAAARIGADAVGPARLDSRAHRIGKKIETWAEWAERAGDAYEFYLTLIANPQPSGERFPRPAAEVVSISNRPIPLRGLPGVVALPNNFGGLNFYDRSGAAIGFCAYAHATGDLIFFDRHGNRV